MKNSMKILIAAMFSCVFIFPVIGSSAPVFPESLHENGMRTDAVYKIGARVYLFHSGTYEVRSAIRINDVLTVYRESPCCNLTEIGKIKVLAFTGDNNIKAVVVEGIIKPGDIAKKGTISCLVMVSGCDCN
jgi:hypothetical protein